MQLSNARFNQDLIDIEGYELYELGNYLTNGEFIVDRRCVNIRHCSVKELPKEYHSRLLSFLSEDLLLEVIKPENGIIKMYDESLYELNLLSTSESDWCIGEEYYELFLNADYCFIYDDRFYFFLDLSTIEESEDEENEIMFVGCVARCQTYKQQIENIKAMNKFIEQLPPARQGEFI